MAKQEARVQEMIDIFQVKKNIDVVFMLDISESMDFFNKLLFSIKEILRFFDEYMEKDDKIGFMRFNQ